MPALGIEQDYQTAVRHHRAGRLHEAQALYRQVLSCQADHADALHLLAVVTSQLGKPEDAADLIRRAIALNPAAGHYFSNLGMVLAMTGQLDEAITAFERALALGPHVPEAHNNLANVLRDTGRLQKAIVGYRRTLALRPDYVEAMYNLAAALQLNDQLDEAADLLKTAIALRPSYPEAFNSLGDVLRERGRPEEAIAAFRKAVALRPQFVEACNNLGLALQEAGLFDEAVEVLRRACALSPELAEPRFALATALLARGDFEQGWPLYEARWRMKSRAPEPAFVQPRWDGSSLAGRRILLHGEQGLGDIIQFIRYVPLVRDRGGVCIVLCPPELRRLLEGQCGIEQVVDDGETRPPFDVHCPLLSLPGLLGTTLQTIPAQVPYLRPDEALATLWQDRLSHEPPALKVGLNWAGSPLPRHNRHRSMPLATLAPLADVTGVRFYSLQKGNASHEANSPPAGMQLVNWSDDLHDFADTAALISALDLAITIDTSVAHLAGALGQPAWVMLVRAPDWRWMLSRDDSPWYPKMRLFRQSQDRDWNNVVDQIARELRALTKQGGMARR